MPKDYKDVDLYLEFIELKRKNAPWKEYDVVWELEIVRNKATSDQEIYNFMLGYWTGAGYYLNFYEKQDSIWCNYNLPYNDNKSVDHYEIVDCVYSHFNSAGQKIEDVFKFTFNSINSVNVYCYSNGATYTLTRSK